MQLRSELKNWCNKAVMRIDIYSLLMFVAIVIIRTIFTSRIDIAISITGADEIGTIASAAYFAGYDWSEVISNTLYYGFGYSLLLAPIFVLFKNPVMIHHMLLFSNNIVLALCAILEYRILIKFFKLEDRRVAVSIAFMTVWYFPLSYHGNIVINESMLQLLVWCVLYLLLYLSKLEESKKRNIGTVVLGIILFYSLLVHSRSIVLIAVVVVTILANYILTKKNIVNSYIFFPLLVIGWFLSKFFVKTVQSRLWLADDSKELVNSVESLFSNLFCNLKILCTYDGIKGYLSELVGQIYSMTVLTYGIFVIACVTIAIFLRSIWKEKCKDNCCISIGIAILYSVMGVATTMLSSSLVALEVVLAHTENDGTSKWFLYNRYWSIYMTVVIMLGGYLLYRYSKKISRIMATSLNLILFIALGFNGYLGYQYGGQELGQTGVYYPYIAIGLWNPEETMTETFFFKITLILLLVFSVFAVLVYKKKIIWAFSFLCMVMFVNYAYGTFNIAIKTSDALSAQFNEMREIVEDAEYTSEYIYCEDYSKFSLWLQYCFPHNKVVFDTESIVEENAIVVSYGIADDFLYGDWDIVYYENVEMLQCDEVYMLVRGEEIKKTLADKGYEVKNLLDETGYFINPYDTSEELKVIGGIANDSVEQHFEITQEMLLSDLQLEIKMATYDRENQGTIRVEVVQDDKVLTYDVNKQDIIDNDWLQINVCDHGFGTGDAMIRIMDLDNDIDNCVTVYLVDTVQLGELYFGDTKMDERIYMRIKKYVK